RREVFDRRHRHLSVDPALLQFRRGARRLSRAQGVDRSYRRTAGGAAWHGNIETAQLRRSTMLKLYGQYRSRAFRVSWLCKESNIPYEHVNITTNIEGATCKSSDYVKLNPNARVPTIDYDGCVMWESAGINLYLAEKYKSPLWPADMKGKGRMLQWAFFNSNDIEPNMVTVMQHRVMF